VIESINRFRYGTQKTYYGDQGIFVKKKVFEDVGGFPEFLIMEASHFCQNLKRVGKLKLMHQPVFTSGRRFIQGGIAKVFIKDVLISVKDSLGFNVQHYAKAYWSHNKS